MLFPSLTLRALIKRGMLFGRRPTVKRLAGDCGNGIRLSKKEMRPYEARLERSRALRKYDITIRPSGR